MVFEKFLKAFPFKDFINFFVFVNKDLILGNGASFSIIKI